MQAYIQYDWNASPHCASISQTNYNREHARLAHEFCQALNERYIVNTATWHNAANGVMPQGTHMKSNDVLRNTREIRQADCVISYFLEDDPPTKHWGSMCLMGYAVGLGKPCYVVASERCSVWRNHFMHHPLIFRFSNVNELIDHLHGNP